MHLNHQGTKTPRNANFDPQATESPCEPGVDPVDDERQRGAGHQIDHVVVAQVDGGDHHAYPSYGHEPAPARAVAPCHEDAEHRHHRVSARHAVAVDHVVGIPHVGGDVVPRIDEVAK